MKRAGGNPGTTPYADPTTRSRCKTRLGVGWLVSGKCAAKISMSSLMTSARPTEPVQVFLGALSFVAGAAAGVAGGMVLGEVLDEVFEDDGGGEDVTSS